MNCLARNPWPGNVRELSNLLERLAILYPEQTISAKDLPERYRSTGTAGWVASGVRVVPPVESAPLALLEMPLDAGAAGDAGDAGNAGEIDAGDMNESSEPAESLLPLGGIDLKDHMSAIEIRLIRKALVEADGTVAEAARLLRIRRTTLVEKLRKYRLSA
jgi:sigma-54 specific flagellar transcriptional regulator A